jgi:large subunit ribosomal protein L28
MARVCDGCGKGKQVGMNVSHAHNRTKAVWRPNLQKIRVVTSNGTHMRVRLCTSCITRGKMTKAARSN